MGSFSFLESMIVPFVTSSDIPRAYPTEINLKYLYSFQSFLFVFEKKWNCKNSEIRKRHIFIFYLFFHFSCFCLFCSKHYASQTSSSTPICLESTRRFQFCARSGWFGSRRANWFQILSSPLVSSFVVLLCRMDWCVNLPPILSLRLHTF